MKSRNTRLYLKYLWKIIIFPFKVIMFPLIIIKNAVDPNWWADLIGEKSGAYDKAKNSKLRQWALGLEGWKWWFYQIVVCGSVFALIEVLLNMAGMTMLPWR